jgi:6,7-dimethyl-8-ribityllumazine synthase
MVQRNPEAAAPAARPQVHGARILILEAPYYADIVNALADGAQTVIAEAGGTAERLPVSGALELPQALAALVHADRVGRDAGPAKTYDGVVVLGCVIRGETSHYDIVCENANHWLMRIALDFGVPLGNAILTMNTLEQAKVRSAPGEGNKGAEAAVACLRLIEIERMLAGPGRP